MKTTKTLVAFAATFVAVACGSQNSAVPPDAGSPAQSSNASSGAPGTASTGTGSGGASTSTVSTSTGGSSSAATGAGGTTSGATGSGTSAGGTEGTGTGTGTGTGEGGTAGNPPAALPNRVRTIIPFDTAWLFNFGDATGAQATAFADTAWRTVNVPHDWAIEGSSPPANPFSETAATTGRGAYVSSGISWYRKHFTLPQTLSGDKVYIEFDGVMENATVYINGTALGEHPYGYTSYRYDMTSSVNFGTTDNVVAVETNTTLQPAERFYAGAGIYRHARILVTNPVHVDQYATFVTTPTPTTASATVNVTTSVVNSGTTSQSVIVQGIVSGPTGTALPAVATAAQTVAAGASATFTFTVPVTSPQLWSLATPNMYSLLTNVQVGGTTVDDDVTPFGIREILFDAGLTINGQATKLQGVANHQDYHALGVAAPQRAIQRRLAQLKALGVNAIRTAHNPPNPDFLDLTDRMGILVLDEFADVWTGHKYSDVGDYAAYFLKAATTPTGLPAVPGVATGATWWEVDFTGWVMRDRNHPSVVAYSMGNEIRDAIATRTPILTEMASILHTLNPPGKITQALFNPATSGDVGGATNTLLDVWGDNYDVASCLKAETSAPTKSSMITEDGSTNGDWASVKANAALTGEFIWTGVDYLGEANTSWPVVGNQDDLAPVQEGGALMDELGNIYPNGYKWQTTWGVTASAKPAAGTTASQIVLTADHATLTTDVNDISFIRAAISDASGAVVTSSATPVTFAITGPGTIVAVDSASMTQETFRGNVRNAYQGLAYALVQATGAGTITVTASATGVTGATATVTATVGTFVPCSGSCD
jgi:beta-galactosidase